MERLIVSENKENFKIEYKNYKIWEWFCWTKQQNPIYNIFKRIKFINKKVVILFKPKTFLYYQFIRISMYDNYQKKIIYEVSNDIISSQ